MIDLGLLFGDKIKRYKPSVYWGIDFSIPDADASDAFHKAVLRSLAIPDNSRIEALYDPESAAFAAFETINNFAMPEVHGFTRYVRAIVDRYPEIAKTEK